MTVFIVISEKASKPKGETFEGGAGQSNERGMEEGLDEGSNFIVSFNNDGGRGSISSVFFSVPVLSLTELKLRFGLESNY